MEQGQIASFRLTPKDILSIRKISICLMLLFTSMVCQPSRAPLPATIVLTLKTRTNRNRFYTCVMSFGRRGYTTVGASRSRHVPNCVREMNVSPISRGYEPPEDFQIAPGARSRMPSDMRFVRVANINADMRRVVLRFSYDHYIRVSTDRMRVRIGFYRMGKSRNCHTR